MSERTKRTVRWGWVNVALFAVAAMFLLLITVQTGSCTDYVDGTGVCTLTPPPDRQWLVLVIGGGVLAFALFKAFRRR
ncbi:MULTISPECIES: hypothetical protein [unclassified Rathayibacter]|jgi:hypothetical protein|uniref:hypothetical protein n=1 Tax=unclassified Rathayibacter TaxID=2609250 RepID=UPI000CE72CBC|nr:MULTISPECIES: hypothetical protein [unclassified Rathayibacter]PPF14101.1 hypothetical protein C5B92_15415 [Rathayibacter sp. AY1A4]PPF14120.1 hypothetical protein C5B92_15520 [Rathayibacter sp. AY1A4]PPH27286.1 hypothetical protein C5C94_15585 [Rathayibacter sp. AY1C3]PPI27204.1 hypothetical protein C5D66_15995 [Rathayibacter sp. AY1B4]